MEGKRGGRHCFGHENLSVWSFSHMTEIRSQWPYGLVFLPVSFLRSLTHICVVNAEEEEERKGKRVQDERLVLFPAEHQTREAWRWRLPGARLALAWLIELKNGFCTMMHVNALWRETQSVHCTWCPVKKTHPVGVTSSRTTTTAGSTMTEQWKK